MKELVTTKGKEVTNHFDTDMLDGVHSFATKLANSGLMPAALRGKPADITIVLLTGKEVGLSPMMALQTISVIKGRQVIEGKALLALIRSNIANPFIKIEAAGKNKPAKCTMARSKSEEDMAEAFTSEWSLERAQTAGLAHKDNYKSHLYEMLQWRCVAEAARLIFPDVTLGLYLRDEVEHLAEDTVSEFDESTANANLVDVDPIDVTDISKTADTLVENATGEAKTPEVLAPESEQENPVKAKAEEDAANDKKLAAAEKRKQKAAEKKAEKEAKEQAEAEAREKEQAEEVAPGDFKVNVGKYAKTGKTLMEVYSEVGPQELVAMKEKIDSILADISGVASPTEKDLLLKGEVTILREAILRYQASTMEDL